ncbi:hypothetical protein [Paracoccus sp. S3-43]|uniref:hypothetical protein n=1 Tax=Paracoccus sp. S3-43 TaxID=3030011 RepID=UPI0023B17573|nr:hypothetical protein [Paracoccus sp. S3-43]WEF24258.1 hypothetical protein PXD02_16000 [Paracoccus sp. S3-43]
MSDPRYSLKCYSPYRDRLILRSVFLIASTQEFFPSHLASRSIGRLRLECNAAFSLLQIPWLSAARMIAHPSEGRTRMNRTDAATVAGAGKASQKT